MGNRLDALVDTGISVPAAHCRGTDTLETPVAPARYGALVNVRLMLVTILVLAACGDASGSWKGVGEAPSGWDVATAAVPKGIELPFVRGGLVLNCYRGTERVAGTIG